MIYVEKLIIRNNAMTKKPAYKGVWKKLFKD